MNKIIDLYQPMKLSAITAKIINHVSALKGMWPKKYREKSTADDKESRHTGIHFTSPFVLIFPPARLKASVLRFDILIRLEISSSSLIRIMFRLTGDF